MNVARTTPNFWDYSENPEVYPVDAGRFRNVVELVTDKAGWGRKLPPGHGLGLAVFRNHLSYTAVVVEAAVDDKGNVTVPRLDLAIDCGPTINPDRVRAQMEGAAIMGMSVALKSKITFKDGKVQQGNFDDYEVLRISEAPRETHVYIVPHGYDVVPGGVGEAGMPTIAPALLNAIYAATGKRIRSLPVGQQLAKA